MPKHLPTADTKASTVYTKRKHRNLPIENAESIYRLKQTKASTDRQTPQHLPTAKKHSPFKNRQTIYRPPNTKNIFRPTHTDHLPTGQTPADLGLSGTFRVGQRPLDHLEAPKHLPTETTEKHLLADRTTKTKLPTDNHQNHLPTEARSLSSRLA